MSERPQQPAIQAQRRKEYGAQRQIDQIAHVGRPSFEARTIVQISVKDRYVMGTACIKTA
jgi:hypothetical protein